MKDVFCDTYIYQYDETFSTDRPVDGFLRKLHAGGVLECARMCSKQTNCMSFFFSDLNKECQLHSDLLERETYVGNVESLFGTKYYAGLNGGMAFDNFC